MFYFFLLVLTIISMIKFLFFSDTFTQNFFHYFLFFVCNIVVLFCSMLYLGIIFGIIFFLIYFIGLWHLLIGYIFTIPFLKLYDSLNKINYPFDKLNIIFNIFFIVNLITLFIFTIISFGRFQSISYVSTFYLAIIICIAFSFFYLLIRSFLNSFGTPMIILLVVPFIIADQLFRDFFINIIGGEHFRSEIQSKGMAIFLNGTFIEEIKNNITQIIPFLIIIVIIPIIGRVLFSLFPKIIVK